MIYIDSVPKSLAGRPATGQGAIYELRQKMDLRQEDLAPLIGISLPTLKRCERDGKLPVNAAAAANVRKLAKKHGIEL